MSVIEVDAPPGAVRSLMQTILGEEDAQGWPLNASSNAAAASLVVKSGAGRLFGFTVYSSIQQAATTGHIPYPSIGERVLGGHAMLVIGYDDNLKITNTITGASTMCSFSACWQLP